MASTPSSRLKLTPSNSPYLQLPARSPRGRALPDLRLSLKRVIGTTCASPTGFDAAQTSFAYVAGGAVVVVDVDGDNYDQRFFRARPTAVPVFSSPHSPSSPATPTSTPKANDSRNRTSIPHRDSSFPTGDWSESPSSKIWTARERIKAATCLALSREGRFLAVGETGYAPRVLIYSLEEASSDTPLVSISEHMFGVKAVAWSHDSRFLASLGAANDGFLFLWKIDARTGAAKLFQQNRCTSVIRGMIWMGNSLITLGQRHVKLWRVEEAQSTSPVKQRFAGEVNTPSGPGKTLPGRNVLLGGLLEATFTCAVAIDETRSILCTEFGDICLLDDSAKQMKLTQVLEIGFVTTCITIRGPAIYVGGRGGNIATLDLEKFLSYDSACIERSETPPIELTGPVAIGFLEDRLVTIDAKQSVDIWSAAFLPSRQVTNAVRIQISGHGDAILGVDVLPQPNRAGASFYTWSGSGKIILWELGGRVKESFNVTVEDAYFGNEPDTANQMLTVKASSRGDFFITGDKSGMMKVIDYSTKECVTEMKAHTADCESIATFEDDSKLLLASCGRDRTAQLFHRTSRGTLEHFQTLEFAAKVVQILIPSSDRIITCSLDRTIQVHDLITKEDDPDFVAAVPTYRSISVKGRPTSMTMAADGKTIFVSLLDRSVCLYDVETSKLINSFKCTDETGVESVVLDSLVTRQATDREPCFLLGISNTDKSVRVYDGQNGSFLDREWGHTEAINGLALVEEAEGRRKVVSVGADGTIMIWDLDLQEQQRGSVSRDSSPMKDSFTSARPTLRRVLSKAELADLQRPSTAGSRKSPPQTLTKRRSLYNLASSASTRWPLGGLQSPAFAIAEDTPSRRPSVSSRAESPPASPKSRVIRRPSLPALKSAKTKSSANLRAFGSLNMATEQACRTLKAYRKKLGSSEPIGQDVLAELDQELRLTSLALGDRVKQSKVISDSILNDVLDQYSSRIMEMLETRLRFRSQSSERPGPESPGKRPGSSGAGSTSDSVEST